MAYIQQSLYSQRKKLQNFSVLRMISITLPSVIMNVLLFVFISNWKLHIKHKTHLRLWIAKLFKGFLSQIGVKRWILSQIGSYSGDGWKPTLNLFSNMRKTRI